MLRAAFIGLGAMGAPMAKRIVSAGFDLSVFDVRPENADPLVDLGATRAGSPREAAEGAEALVLMVVNAEQAENALFGEDGAAETLSPKSAVVLMSTIGPEAVRGIEGRLAGRGAKLLDAPVSGGVARAERGDLLIMAGGPADLFEEVNPLLCGVHIAAAGEALAYGEALGLDPRSVFETIRHGAANSFMLEDRGERMLGREFVPAKSALDIFVKDMGLVRLAAGEQGFRTPLADAAHRLYQVGSSLGLGEEDDSGVVRVFENADGAGRAGVSLQI